MFIELLNEYMEIIDITLIKFEVKGPNKIVIRYKTFDWSYDL